MVRGRSLAVRFRPVRGDGYRLAVVVSRKVSKSAVVRNRIRRRVFEIIRTEPTLTPIGFAVALTVYDISLATIQSSALAEQIATLFRKAGLGSPRATSRGIVESEESE